MPADNNLIFTSGVFLSNLSTMIDGVPANFTTPRVVVGQNAGLPLSPNMVARLFIPAFTNRSPGSGVGAFTRPIMTAVVQGNAGDPATAGGWVDVASLYSQKGSRAIRPHVALSSTGAGGPRNPIFSNVAVARFAGGEYTNYRISGQYLGSFPDFSAVVADLRLGHRAVDPELF